MSKTLTMALKRPCCKAVSEFGWDFNGERVFKSIISTSASIVGV